MNSNQLLDDAGYTREVPVRGKGMERKNLGFEKLPNVNSKGWRGIIARHIHKILENIRELKAEDRKKAIKSLGIVVENSKFKKNNDELFNSLGKSFKKKS